MPTSPTGSNVCAVIVTHNPDEGFMERLQLVSLQVDEVIVVDNGSHEAIIGTSSSPFVNRILLIENPENRGIAAALNQGLALALDKGFDWAITLDQDSEPAPDMIEKLLATLASYKGTRRVAMIGPTILEKQVSREAYRWLRPNTKMPLLYERAACTDSYLDNVTFIITSGALIDLRVFELLGPFEESFFIDYVDHEYCLRARGAGYEILVSANAKLLHNLGNKREFALAGHKVRPTFHGAERLYYMHRNRIPMIRKYAFSFPHWFLFDVIATSYNMCRVLLFEDKRRQKLLASLRGTVDGLRGRMGPGRR